MSGPDAGVTVSGMLDAYLTFYNPRLYFFGGRFMSDVGGAGGTGLLGSRTSSGPGSLEPSGLAGPLSRPRGPTGSKSRNSSPLRRRLIRSSIRVSSCPSSGQPKVY